MRTQLVQNLQGAQQLGATSGVGLSNDGEGALHLMLTTMATAINKAFQDIMSIATMLSTGIVLANGVTGNSELLEKLERNGVTIDGVGINTCSTSGVIAGNDGSHQVDGTAIQHKKGDFVPISTWTDGIEGTEIAARKIDNSALMENPGTLFLIQQIMTQMKDSMAALQAAAGVGGQVVTASMADFKQNLR